LVEVTYENWSIRYRSFHGAGYFGFDNLVSVSEN
jgi:hypothetical protein